MEKEIIEEQTQTVKVKSGIVKKIFSIALIVLCAALVMGATLCSFLPKNFNPGLENPDYIRIFSTTNASANNTTYYKGSEEYKKLMSLYNESFETTWFGALFQGKASEGVTEKEGYTSLSSLSGTHIEFNYYEVQKIRINGKTLEEAGIESQFSNQDYRSVVIEVLNSESLKQINVYFRYNDSGSTTYSYIRFLTYAEQAPLYEYIDKM